MNFFMQLTMLQAPAFHERPWVQEVLRDRKNRLKKKREEFEREIEEWADQVVNSFPFVIEEEKALICLNTRFDLRTSYGKNDTPPLPRIISQEHSEEEEEYLPEAPKKRRRRHNYSNNKTRAELYSMYAMFYSEEITIEELISLQEFHLEFASIKLDSIKQGICRARR